MNNKIFFLYSYNTPPYSYYYYTAAVFAVCRYIARPPSLATAFVGYTRLCTAAVPGTINNVP